MAANIQCESILSGIQKLEKYLQDKIVRESLELDKNAETSKYSDLLSRLKLSLTQYTEREKNLVYVGFMGQFSTGKSSTINSLLNLGEDPKNSRKVGLNPVDKSITLITHNENRDSLMNLTKESLVSIRSSFIENDFLKSVVIADTPGTGDPLLIHAIAQDFLPICDLIVYFFSSTAPLGSADIALLTEKSSELPFIPIKFVITRADEFRKDRSMNINDNNFDISKAQDFLNELGQRVRFLFKESSDINSDSFILIDNLHNYNLDSIRKTIIDFTNESNVSVQINIHSHKILYFRQSAEKLQEFFCLFLQSKLKFLSEVLDGADININRFRGKIQVANNSLTQSWNEKFREINEAKFKLLSNKLLLEFSLPELNDLINTHQRNIFEIELQSAAMQKQNEINEKIIDVLRLWLEKFIRGNRDVINEISSLGDIKILQSLKLDFNIISKDQLIENIDFFPISELLKSSLSEVRCLDDKLIDYYNDLNRNLDELQKTILNQIPLKELKGMIDDAVNALGRDFDNYFEAIAVYRTGIFSLGAKDAISKLGLSSQMDGLEANELTETRKLSIKQESQECLFPNNREILSNSFNNLANLIPKVSELQFKVKKLSSKKSLLIADIPDSEININTAVDYVKQNLFDDLDNALQERQEFLNSKISSLVFKSYEEWKLKVEEMKNDRINRIRTFIIVTCIVSSLLYIIFLYFSKIDLASNVANIIISSFLVNVISSPFGRLFEKLTDKFPENIKQREAEILSRLRFEYSDTISNESTINLKSFIKLDSKIVTNLWFKILVTKPRKNWRSQREDFHKDLGLCLSEYNRLCIEYSEIVKKSAEISSEYFADTQENLRKLDSFAAELQSESIQPSFSLLESTKLNLESIIQKIRAIEFT